MFENGLLEEAEKLYKEMTASGIDTILDDRDERVGVKFNDMELIGIPVLQKLFLIQLILQQEPKMPNVSS